MPESTEERKPNILITGTPGTGKSTTSQALFSALKLENIEFDYIDIGTFVKSNQLYESFDHKWSSYTVDEDKLLDALDGGAENKDISPTVPTRGGYILDWHTCDAFPESWIDLVVVLRTNHSDLWERLEKRGYKLEKIQENNEAEIMQVVLEEAMAAYPLEIVIELQSQTTEDVDSNVDRIVSWVKSWMEARKMR